MERSIGSFLIGLIGYGSAIMLMIVAFIGVGHLPSTIRANDEREFRDSVIAIVLLLGLAAVCAVITRWLLS